MRARLVAIVASVTLAASTVAGLGSAANSAGALNVTSITDIGVPGSFPWGTAFDATGRVWVAMPGCDPSPSCSSGTPPGKLARYDPVSSSWTTTVSLPAGYGQPLFVEVDSAGRVWFTMPVTNAIGVYDPGNATVQQWPVPTASSGPWDLEIDPQGTIWFAEHFTNKIGAFDPSTHTFREISTPAANSNPYGITVDTAGNVWFTENTDSVALIAEYTTQGVLNEFRIRNTPTGGTGLTPHMIILDRAGDVWWSEGWVSAIAKLSVASAQPGTNAGVTEYQYYTPPCGTCQSHTSGISVDSQGLIWFDDSVLNRFGSFPVGGGSFALYSAPGRHPHDGLRVDAGDRVWFDEEFSNRIAVAVQSDQPPPTTVPTTTTTLVPPVAGTVLGADTFVRADQSRWGTASDGQGWGGDANNVDAFSVAHNAALVTNTGGNSYSAVLGPAAKDSEVVATGSISSFNNSNFGDVVRFTDTNNWYKAYIDGQNLIIQKKSNGSTTTLATKPFVASAGVSYTIRFRAVGSTLTVNAWASAGVEPNGWMLSADDSTFASGRTGMRVLTQLGTLTLTAYQATVPGGSLPPPSTTTTTPPTSTTTTSTATTTTTTSAPTSTTTTTTITTGSPGAGTALGADTFVRADQSRWGTASDGQGWGGDANNQNAFSVWHNTGLVANTGATSYSAVLGPAAANTEVHATGSISSFNQSNFGDVVRFTDNNNWYKAYIDGQSLIIQKRVNGTTTVLASKTFAASPGVSYTIHFRAVGSTLTVNAWASSGVEPSGWMLTANDSTFASGRTGMRVLTQAGTLTITAYQARSV